MNSHVLQQDSSPPGPEKYTPEALKQIGRQVEEQTSRHSSLKFHKRAIEQQLTSIAAHIHAPVGVLIPGNIFLLLEMRGSGGVSDQLEQIVRILHEQGYWKPQGRVCNYHRQDVYHLGKSVQQLFDDYTALDRRIEQVQAQLRHIKQCRQVVADTTPQEVFTDIAASADLVSVQSGVDAIVQLLRPAQRSRWLLWFIVHRSRMQVCRVKTLLSYDSADGVAMS
jgi:hypothetical protein